MPCWARRLQSAALRLQQLLRLPWVSWLLHLRLR